jgi:hypothetical protein
MKTTRRKSPSRKRKIEVAWPSREEVKNSTFCENYGSETSDLQKTVDETVRKIYKQKAAKEIENPAKEQAFQTLRVLINYISQSK